MKLFRRKPPARVYLVRCLWEAAWPPLSYGWKDERVVTDSAENALAMVDHYRTTLPAPLMFAARVVENLGPYPGGQPRNPTHRPEKP